MQSNGHNGHISLTGDIYQDRLNRLESDKESLVLQVTFSSFHCFHFNTFYIRNSSFSYDHVEERYYM